MKKGLFIFGVILVLIFIIGCNQKTANIKLLDEITKMPINGEALINGTKVAIEDGVLKTKDRSFEIEVSNYLPMNANLSEDTKEITLYLKPSSWISINCNVQEPQILIDNNIIESFVVSKDSSIIISPVSQGNHTLSISKQYFIEKEMNITVIEGENNIEVKLEQDENALSMLLDSLIFPSEKENYNFNISINGTFYEKSIEDTISGEVRNKEVYKMKDSNIEYTFQNGKPYIDGQEVKDEEKSFALLFSKNTVENFLSIKEYIKGLTIKDFTNGFLTLYGKRDFEGRSYDEEIIFSISDSTINRIALTISSQELNTKLLVTLDIEEE